MSRGWKRYGEARLYLIGSSVGLLAVVWSVLAAHDRSAGSEAVTQVTQTVIEAPTAASAPVAGSGQVQAAPAATPQTRTRGS
jgi:hypothetical protein